MVSSELSLRVDFKTYPAVTVTNSGPMAIRSTDLRKDMAIEEDRNVERSVIRLIIDNYAHTLLTISGES